MFIFELLDLAERFTTRFQVVPALTPDLRDQVFRIRHNVYCEELGLEPQRRDWRETDEYDSRSLHCLLRNVVSGEFAACARFIRAGSEAEGRLPIEKHALSALYPALDRAALRRDDTGEISRFAVMRNYRRRRSDAQSLIGVTDESFGGAGRPRFPFIAVALSLALVELARRSGVRTLFVLTEPQLPAQFERLGVRVQTVGTPVQGRGLRIPAMIDCEATVDALNFALKPLYTEIAAEIDAAAGPPRGGGLAAPA